MFPFFHSTEDKHPYRGKVFLVLIFIFLDLAAFFGYISLHFLAISRPFIFADSSSIPAEYATAILFGAGLDEDGTMGEMLSDRVAAAAKLHREGRVTRIIVTGDDGARREDEVTVMRQALLETLVPAEHIILDPHGYRTYESCYRARHIFGVTRAVAISQNFHLPRILYLCGAQGIDMVGYSADAHDYSAWWVVGPREFLARVKAWWQSEITQPLPRVLE